VVSEATLGPISSGPRRFSWQVDVGPVEGVDHDSVVTCESITTLPRALLQEQSGELVGWREDELRAATSGAFGLLPVFD